MKAHWIAAAVAYLVGTPALAADVSVTLTGVKPKGGKLYVVLYDEATFLKAKGVRTAVVEGDAARPTVTLKDVPPGDYAVGAHHDADDDGKMTMGADGRMGEGTGLSNSAALRAMPTFATTKVAVPAAGAQVSVAMSYPEDRTGW